MKSESIIIDPSHINAEHENGLNYKEEAVKSLFNEIKQRIMEKCFDEAEELRLQLYEIDNRAVHEIFESGRLIKNAKKEAEFEEELDRETRNKNVNIYIVKPNTVPNVYQEPISVKPQHSINNFPAVQRVSASRYDIMLAAKTKVDGNKFSFMAHWFQFFNTLPPDYLNSLIPFVTTLTCTIDETLIMSAQPTKRLYFINKGNVNIFHDINGDTKTSQLADGDIIGGTSFFSGAKSPITAIAEKGSEIKYLEFCDLMKLKTIFPDIDEVLCSLCVSHILKRNADHKYLDARFHERFNTEGIVRVKVVNVVEKHPSFRGDLRDISNGGFAFEIETDKTSIIYSMKNKRIKAAIDIHSEKIPLIDLLWGGQVVGINQSGDFRYSVHVKGHEKNNNVNRLIEKLQ